MLGRGRTNAAIQLFWIGAGIALHLAGASAAGAAEGMPVGQVLSILKSYPLVPATGTGAGQRILRPGEKIQVSGPKVGSRYPVRVVGGKAEGSSPGFWAEAAFVERRDVSVRLELQAAEQAASVLPHVGTMLSPPNACASGGASTPPAALPSRSAAVVGARRIFAAIYQDCSVNSLAIGPGDSVPAPFSKTRATMPLQGGKSRELQPRVFDSGSLKKYLAANPMIQSLASRGDYPAPGCRDVRQAPPVYSFGAKPGGKPGQIPVLQDLRASGCPMNGTACESASVTGMDCSGFISAAFSAGGLRFDSDATKQPSDPFSVSTQWLADIPRRASACLEHATFHPEGLRPGDVVNLSPHHVLMIDEVGADPFGIQKVRDCNDLGVEHLDFTYIHSGAIGDMGVARIKASYHAAPEHRSVLMANLAQLGRRICRARKQAENSRPLTSEGAPQFSVLRHVGASKSGCVIPPNQRAKIQGGQCIESCKL